MAKTSYKKSSKPSGPPKENRADKESSSIENDIIEFWYAIGNSEIQQWKKPWVYNMLDGENAGKFLLNDERKIYQGGFNQFLLASYTRNYDSNKAMLVMTRTDMTEIFGATDFAETPVVKNSIKSIGSIYSPPVQKTIGTYWNYPNGNRWSGEAKYPSKEEVDRLGLVKKETKRPVFNTYPVWSVHDVYDVLPDNQKAKIDDLVALRKAKGYDFNAEDPIETLIDQIINETIAKQGIEVTEHGNSAYYVPALDKISNPEKDQFVNPVARYAVTFHELAHSTKHITGRNPVSRNKTEYAIEEVVAETTAVIMVKHLERRLTDVLESRPDIQLYFQEYYANAMSYNHGYGDKFNFTEEVAGLVAERENNKGLIKTILVNISKAVDTLTNGTFTPEQRLEFKNKNFSRVAGKEKTAELAI